MKQHTIFAFFLLLFSLLVSCQLPAEEVPEEEPTNPNLYTLHGYLLPSYTEDTAGITLDDALTLSRTDENGVLKLKTFHAVFFSDTQIYDYVDRKHFVYYDDKLTVSETARIPIEISFDFTQYMETGALLHDSFLWSDSSAIISVDGNTDLLDMQDTAYSLATYKEIFYRYCLEGEPFLPDNVKETYYYVNTDTEIGTIYQDAVDTILESGLYIYTHNNNYILSEEEQLPEPLALDDLALGDHIGGLEITHFDYEKGRRIHMELNGPVTISGSLVYDEYIDGPYFIASTSPLPTPIAYQFDSGFEHTLQSFNGALELTEDASIDDEILTHLQNGMELFVSITMDRFTLIDQDMSQGNCIVTASLINWQPTEPQ